MHNGFVVYPKLFLLVPVGFSMALMSLEGWVTSSSISGILGSIVALFCFPCVAFRELLNSCF